MTTKTIDAAAEPETTTYTRAELSLMLDRATLAVAAAEASGDDFRLKVARVWKRRVEALLFGEAP